MCDVYIWCNPGTRLTDQLKSLENDLEAKNQEYQTLSDCLNNQQEGDAKMRALLSESQDEQRKLNLELTHLRMFLFSSFSHVLTFQ